MMTPTKTDYLRRLGTLKNERSSWFDHWRELADFVLPRTGRWMTQNSRNESGQKKHNNILDNTGTRALRVLGAGLMAGATSPARPWFRLATSDPELNESSAVKLWLAESTATCLRVFQKSNAYRAFHHKYEELGLYGTAASFVADDFDTVLHYHTLTAGEYCLAGNQKGLPDTLYRETSRTVSELVKEFGRDSVSQTVRNLFDRGNLDQLIQIAHVIEPRSDREYDKRDALNMPWRSVYFEPGGESEKLLREGGFKRFRVLAPRWDVNSGDIYGSSPAMDALGDIKQLQHQQKRKLQGIDYQTNPPLQAPTDLRNAINRLPGGISFYDQSQPHGGIRSAFEVNLNLQHLLADNQDTRERIRQAFYSDLFLMLADGNNGQMTATEVAERHEEKMLMLGPVLERLHNELLEPSVDVTFERCLEAGILPPVPQELNGQELQIEFVSVLAQAQRAIQTNGIDRFTANLGVIAQIKPEVLDRLDADRWADVYADSLGVDPSLVVPAEKAALVRQQRAEAQAQQTRVDQAEQIASAAGKIGATAPSGGDMMQQLTGYGS